MVSISHETSAATATRLRSVITQSRLTVYDKPHAFEEFPLANFATKARQEALALVRDDRVWSQLIQCDERDKEPFAIWRFHFPEGVDNSGFVGWLASHLKMAFGTGVFVVCGQNSADGGIFDYWGCPWSLRDVVLDAVVALASRSVSH